MSPKVKVPINNKILEWCIQDYNISIEEVAKKLGTTTAKVQSWIDNVDSPTYKQAENLAYKVFKKPLAIFFMPTVPTVLSVKKKFRSIPDYLFDLTTYKTRLAINKADFYKTVLYELYKRNPSESPIFKSIKTSFQADPKKLAQHIRGILGISLDRQNQFRDKYKAFNYYRSALESKGIFTFQLPLEGDKAFCLLDEEFPIIIVNSGDSPYSKIFSLFHELAHILTENEDIYKEITSPAYTNNPLEIFCNQVAAEVLVPISEFQLVYGIQIKSWNEEIVQAIANDYCVSKEVILRKLLELGIANSVTYSDFKKKWDKAYYRSESSGGDFYRNKVSALGRTYVYKVIDKYKSGVINDNQVADYLGIKYAQLSKIEAEVYA